MSPLSSIHTPCCPHSEAATPAPHDECSQLLLPLWQPLLLLYEQAGIIALGLEHSLLPHSPIKPTLAAVWRKPKRGMSENTSDLLGGH